MSQHFQIWRLYKKFKVSHLKICFNVLGDDVFWLGLVLTVHNIHMQTPLLQHKPNKSAFVTHSVTKCGKTWIRVWLLNFKRQNCSKHTKKHTNTHTLLYFDKRVLYFWFCCRLLHDVKHFACQGHWNKWVKALMWAPQWEKCIFHIITSTWKCPCKWATETAFSVWCLWCLFGMKGSRAIMICLSEHCLWSRLW